MLGSFLKELRGVKRSLEKIRSVEMSLEEVRGVENYILISW